MRPGARVALLLLPLVAAAASGCTAYNDLQRFLHRLQGTETVEVERLNAQVRFAWDEPFPPSQSPLGEPRNFTFTVPAEARVLRVEAEVTLRALDSPLDALPLAAVNITVRPPGGAARTMLFEESASQVLTASPPAPGDWTVLVQARGEGRVQLWAITEEPAR